MSDTGWLDAHFQTVEAEYWEMIESVGFEKGWHILDAGCGGGSFIPLISELVGGEGYISGIDVSAENVEAAQGVAKNVGLGIGSTFRVGSVSGIPYADNTFDGVWCANVVQYLTSDETSSAFAEFLRVCRPGGIVAVKEFDLTMLQFYPLDPGLLWREMIAARSEFAPFDRMLRIPELLQLMVEAGFVECWQQTAVMERRQPLREVERVYIGGVLNLHASSAKVSKVSDTDLAEWRQYEDVDSPSHILQRDDFYFRAGQSLIVGRVPHVSSE